MHDCLAIPLPCGRTGRAGASIQQGIGRQLEEENRKLKQLVGDSPKAQLPGRGPPRSQVPVVAGERNQRCLQGLISMIPVITGPACP